jgi:hypothetical protein
MKYKEIYLEKEVIKTRKPPVLQTEGFQEIVNCLRYLIKL